MKNLIDTLLILLAIIVWVLTLFSFSLTFEFDDDSKVHLNGWVSHHKFSGKNKTKNDH